MKKPSVFIIVPSLISAGPIKGAVALCNGLAEQLPISLIFLKPGPSLPVGLDSRVKLISMANRYGWHSKILAVRNEFQQAGDHKSVFSISFCFSADVINYFSRRMAVTISSPRGNLFKNHRFDYGIAGLFLAWLHYYLIKRFDFVVAMSGAMADQLKAIGIRRFNLIGNFLDEAQLEPYRRNGNPSGDQVRFAFLASLTNRKRADLAITSLNRLIQAGFDCQLDIIGEGPLKKRLIQIARQLSIDRHVTFYGHLSEPYVLLQKADFMLLPSESEGVSRAVMEALFFGVPCILRDVDANKEIISEGVNGFLFKSDNDLAGVMKKAALSRINNFPQGRANLLPPMFRKINCIEKYTTLINANL